MTAQKHSLEAFFRKDPKRARAILAALCIGVAVLAVVICMLFLGGSEEPSGDDSGELLQTWPDSPLLEGIPQPEDGTLVSARQEETVVAVFYEDVPSSALESFLTRTGLEFRGTAPYVAHSQGRTIAVEYDAKEGKLSITVIKE